MHDTYPGERDRFGENHIVEKGWGCISLEVGVDSERLAYRCLKEVIFLEGGVDYGSVICDGEEGGIQLFWRGDPTLTHPLPFPIFFGKHIQQKEKKKKSRVGA